jgi:AcrR family transcriptional regulator
MVADPNVNAARWGKVLDAALEVFALRGYERASMNDIAVTAGLKKPSLYHYMQSKEDLLEAIIVRSHERLIGLLAAIPAKDSALEMVRAIVYTHVLFNISYGAEAAVFQSDFRMLAPERQVPIRENLAEYDRSLQALIEEAQRRKEASPTVDAKLAVLWMMGGANHLVRWYRPKRGSNPEAIAAQFADLSISGLRGTGSELRRKPDQSKRVG